MSTHRRMLLATIALPLALVVPTVATAAPNSPIDNFDRSGTAGPVETTFRPSILDKAGNVNVMVQLKGDPVAVAEAKADRTFSTPDRKRVKQTLRMAQDAIADDIAARGGKVLSHLQSAYNGMRVQIARGKAASLASLPGVVAVHSITPRTLNRTVSVPYLGVPQVWQDTGYTGKGVKVGIIDTGIDYTHADFGGPGTTDAFEAEAATSTEPADPTLFGRAAPRVKGGYDFVGDDYDPNAAAGSPALTPKPDLNPLDCNGHGSHVAGTAGGSGVTADGRTFTGPYDSSTPAREFKVGPGVAPQVDLYALRVFGCNGSTDMVTEAIDWAVDYQLDVINLSLGGPFGRSDSPDAVAASNAVGAGVVVVASAGNSGQNPYLAAAPGVGEGVIAVSAVDSTASSPGAKLQDGYQSYASMSSAGPATGDSGLSPNVAAPGVAISSVGVGTGNDAAIGSGTSMAAPHVAGVAALGVQAHPTWSAQAVAAAVSNTADPEKVKDYSVTLGGGLVDAAQTVTTQTFVTGDRFRTTSGAAAEATLSYGFAEPMKAFVGRRVLTIHNRGTRAVTYRLTREKDTATGVAEVRFSSRKVRVPAGGKARVAVTLVAPAAAVGSSLGGDQFGFREVSGNVLLTSGDSTLRVPYLLVPRAQANVDGELAWSRGSSLNAASGKGKPTKLSVELSNRGGALDAVADFYTWGLSDARDVSRASGGSGYDLRAAGVQSFDMPDGKFIVFAVNNHDRWSNPASQEFDVLVDTNNDGSPDYAVFSFDSGFLEAGGYNGQPQVYIYNFATGARSSEGYRPVAPTDSSTILLPVTSAKLGLEAGSFNYTVASFTAEDGAASDEFSGWASYDPWAKAIADGANEKVARNGRITVPVTVDPVKFAAQKPKGVMVVVFDNKSGAREALLLGVQ